MERRKTYKDIYELLRSEILSGKYSSSRKFPSSTALARRFKASRFTIRQALEVLKVCGFVRMERGSGTFLAKAAQSRLIGLVIPGISYSSEFFHPIIASLLHLAHLDDYTILMDGVWTLNSNDNTREAVEVAARLIKQKVAGIIYQPLEYSESSEIINRRVLAAFAKARIPVVLLDGDIVQWPKRSEYDLVSIDNIAAGETLGAHLTERGARNICFLMRKNWVQNVLNRAYGVRNVVLARGLEWSESNVVFADPANVDEVSKLMRRRPRPDAFVCENDVLAAGLKLSLEKLGYKIPDDVQIAGFDDVQIARFSTPGITTIHQPCDLLAKAAFERLMKRMSLRSLDPLHIVCPFSLVPRGTTLRQCVSFKSKKGGLKNE